MAESDRKEDIVVNGSTFRRWKGKEEKLKAKKAQGIKNE